MFDFGFSELLVICVVALVVLGPTRLPGLVRKVGRWVGKARSMARDFREQLENEVNLDELNRMTTEQSRPAPRPPAPTAAAPASAAGDEPAAAQDPANLAGSGYPYGTPTDTSARSADPAVTADEPWPEDDTFSHAHAHGAAPAPWDPEADGTVAATPEPAAGAEEAADDKPDSRPA